MLEYLLSPAKADLLLTDGESSAHSHPPGYGLPIRPVYKKAPLTVTLVYLAPFLRYGDLLAENYEFFLSHCLLTPSLG